MNESSPVILPSREKIYFRRRRERREISEACETHSLQPNTLDSMFTQKKTAAKSQKSHAVTSNPTDSRTTRVILPYF